jgi:hypothetical protein
MGGLTNHSVRTDLHASLPSHAKILSLAMESSIVEVHP